jgi:hypothetical protein
MAYSFVTVSRIPSYQVDGGLSIITTYRVSPGSAVIEFMQRLAGGPKQLGNRIVFVRPHADPQCPWLYAQDITSAPLDDSYPSLGSADNSFTVPAHYDEMMVTATYKRPKFEVPEGGDSTDSTDKPETPSGDETEEIELATASWDFAGQSQKIPGSRLGWDNGAGAIDKLIQNTGNDSATWVIPTIQIASVRHFVPVKPSTAITSMYGRINKSAFRIGGDTWAAETIRFDGASVSRKYTNRGAKYFELTYKFAIMPVYDKIGSGAFDFGYVGWNRKYDFDAGYWRKVITAGTVQRAIFLLDEDAPTQTIGGRVVKGFNLLFHPAAK